MNVPTKNLLIGSSIGASVGFLYDFFQDKKQKNKLPDVASHNPDEMESVYSDTDPAEKGLTQLDSDHRSEWQGMGYPQTHKEIE